MAVTYRDEESMPLLVELQAHCEELDQNVLRRLIPLDKAISTKQHHIAYKNIQYLELYTNAACRLIVPQFSCASV